MKKLLVITNGHGEDIIAAEIIRHLALNKIRIDVLPVVGKGDVFKGIKVDIIGPKKVLPGGGFGLRNFSYLIKDIFSGLISKIFAQIRVLRQNRDKYDLVVGVGDIVPLIYSLFISSPFILVGVNKSAHYKKLAFNYTSLEKWLLKKHSFLVLARDKKTADSLSLAGIRSRFVGNPMMDGVPASAKASAGKQGIRRSEYRGVRKSRNKIVGFLPGTREDAYKNIEDFNKIAWQINKLDKNIHFVLSFPGTLDKDKLKAIRMFEGMQVLGDFNKVLASSNIIIGLSGTGNEQAAGCGIPVISFPGRGAQYNFKFAVGQKELLGEALVLLPRDSNKIATAAISILYNSKLMAKMGKDGQQRMGRPGASNNIAKIIMKHLGIKK